MFEDLFVDRRTIANYRTAPLLEERLIYLEHCAQMGTRRTTLRRLATHQASLVQLLGLREPERIGMPRIRAAVEQRWRPGGHRRSSRPASPHVRKQFLGHAVRWLRFVDMLEEPRKARHAHADEVAVFGAWMRNERGWSENTIRECCRTVDHFCDWLDEGSVALDSVRIAAIDQAIARWYARDCARNTIHNYAWHLRTFFRFAEGQGWCTPGLADGIMPPRFHRGETVPKGLDRDEVLRLLATTSESDRPVDVRDRAILMVLSAYGLRAGEVIGLRLDDLDWREERLQVRRPKPGLTHSYPLSRGVGQAIVHYITDVRPPRPERTLFLTLNAPIRPLGRSAISGIVKRRLDRIGITGKRRGPHALRHAAAQHLLDHGLSMKEIGDYLGHRSISSTAVYAKVQLGTLREVAEIDLEGLA